MALRQVSLLEVVYEFLMTKKASPQSTVLGYVRGTAIVVNNTVGGNTFFVQNVIHYDSGSRRGTLSQQGEAIFENSPWEFAITGGTGIFRNASSPLRLRHSHTKWYHYRHLVRGQPLVFSSLTSDLLSLSLSLPPRPPGLRKGRFPGA
ncbi:hypothetical protein KP509_21G039500 [Ceratopteris richardii]|uniref:Dirigent protein n=1 Tax=Ceratopteris richardii TaxID=49495 RepID=A0A8T2SAK7_CERRI|nr:hypothetical protein KP509_21G039500 [Ceratopteris richardii]